MASKKSKTKNIRNILESPINVTWEEKSSDELAPIQSVLKEVLPNAKLQERTLAPWKKGEKKPQLPREENLLRCHLALGYESVMRGMEKKELSCVLLSNDVTPILLLKMALVHALTNSVPVLVIPDLKAITKATIGFSSIALGFKNDVAENTIFYPIIKLVSQNPTVIESPFLNNNETTDLTVLNQKPQSTLQACDRDVNIKYLYREKNGIRAFVQGGPAQNQICTKPEKRDNSWFIAFDEPKNQVQSHISKRVNQQSEGVMMESDDSESDEGDNLFFIDNRPDNDLLKKGEENKVKLPGNKPTNLNSSSKKKKSKSKNSKEHKFKLPGEQQTNLNPSSKKKKSKFKKSQENKVKISGQQEKNVNTSSKLKKSKEYLLQSISARFQHPNLKAVSSHIKRSNKKNKNKKKNNSSL